MLWLDNYISHIISHVASKLNNNINPKHRIMNYHQFFLDNISYNSKALDIGAGIGVLVYDITKKAQEVLAIVKNKNNIEIVKKKI